MEAVFPESAKWLIVTVFVIGFILSIGWACFKKEFGLFLMGAMLTSMVAFGSIVISSLVVKPTPSGRYEYEVIFDDSVNLRDVYEYYEVVKTKGDIYTLRDLEAVAEKSNYCSNCGLSFDDDDRFCVECGTKR